MINDAARRIHSDGPVVSSQIAAALQARIAIQMPSPPPRGVGFSCKDRSFGWSNKYSFDLGSVSL